MGALIKAFFESTYGQMVIYTAAITVLGWFRRTDKRAAQDMQRASDLLGIFRQAWPIVEQSAFKHGWSGSEKFDRFLAIAQGMLAGMGAKAMTDAEKKMAAEFAAEVSKATKMSLAEAKETVAKVAEPAPPESN